MIFDNLIRENLKNFKGYSSARKEENNGNILLNANESPYNNFYSIGNYNISLNRYPEQQPLSILKIMSEYYNINLDQLIITRGSDEGIDILIRTFCNSNEDSILICPPTYGMYEICAQIQGAKICYAPLKKEDNFQIDISLILNKINNNNIKIVFLCTPNNPTGNLLNEDDILLLCKKTTDKVLIVVDEAYIEYSGKNSLITKLSSYQNLIILRTLSKSFGLAGIRCGSLIAHNKLIEILKNILPPYPISVLNTAIIEENFKEKNMELMKERILQINNERERIKNRLLNLKNIKKIYTSYANYLLIEFENYLIAFNELKNNGITVRNMNDHVNLKNCIRISVGSIEENNKLVYVLSNMELN
jgi:histidinol-phosphate aminotransferase